MNHGTGSAARFSDPNGAVLDSAGNVCVFHITDSNGNGYWLAPALYEPALGSWHQYVVTKAGTNYTTYIDGLQASNGTNYTHYVNETQSAGLGGPSSIPSGITAPLTIGEVENVGWLNGKLDDIRIYDRALSAGEVATFYAIEGGSLLNGLVAYYPFNGNANDESGNGNNGTAQNADLTTDRFGVSDHAYQFNGANAFISAPNQSYLSFPNGGDFTMSVWAALSALPSLDTFFMGMDNGPGDHPKWILTYGKLNIPNPPSGNYVHFITTLGTGSGVANFPRCRALFSIRRTGAREADG